jgi:hypothetical protein
MARCGWYATGQGWSRCINENKKVFLKRPLEYKYRRKNGYNQNT